MTSAALYFHPDCLRNPYVYHRDDDAFAGTETPIPVISKQPTTVSCTDDVLPIHIAAGIGNEEMLRACFGTFDVNAADPEGTAHRV